MVKNITGQYQKGAVKGSIFSVLVVVTLVVSGFFAVNTLAATTVNVTNLQPSWNAPGGGGVYSVYYGPNDGYNANSPGNVASYLGHEAAPISAGLTIDPTYGIYEDQGLFGFKPGDVPIEIFASQSLTYDFVSQYGANPVWVYIELNKNVPGDTMYQYVPTSNSASWHTEDAATGTHWQAWTNLTDGITTGPMLSLEDIAAANPGKTVSRVYLTEGMGDSYHDNPNGTVAWVDMVTIGATTYNFVDPCNDNILDVPSEFSSIQDAMGHVTDSCSTIRVAAGTYNESLLVNKPLTIVGTGLTKPIITGVSSVNYIVKIDGVTSGPVTLDNLNIDSQISGPGSGTFTDGILVNHSGTETNPVEIKNSTVTNVWSGTDNTSGIEAKVSSYVLVHHNTVSSFFKNGIKFIASSGKVYSNEVIGHDVNGTDSVQNLVNLWGGSNVEIYSNKLHNALTTGTTPTWTSTGVLVSAYNGADSNVSSQANIHNNEIYADDTGIVIGSVYAAGGHDPSAPVTGHDTSSVAITNNNLHDLATGINFEQGTITAAITGNSFLNISSSTVDATISCVSTDVTDPVCNTDTGEPNVSTPGVTASTVTDLTHNWWGQGTGPTTGQIYSSITSTASPWYTNAAMTKLSDDTATDATYTSTTSGQADLPAGVTTVVLDDTHNLDVSGGVNTVSGGNVVVGGVTEDLSNYTGGDLGAGFNLDTAQTVGDKQVTVDQAVTLQSGTNGDPIILTNSNLSDVAVSIPDGTTILAPTGWDGTIDPPTAGSSSGETAPSGFSVGSTVIDVGSPGVILLFDQAVKITLTGVTGTVGYKPAGSDNWVTIDTQCNSATDYSNISFPNECYYPNGSDTIIWTYHFTSFGSLTATPAPASSSGGGYSFGFEPYQPPATPTPAPTITPTPTPQGQVLGEAITRGNPANLTANGLKEGDTVSAVGSSDPDVYIVNQFGYKRLFLSPVIFEMYGHLKNGWGMVRSIVASARDSFPTSGLFRNCETNDLKVYALETTGEDTATLHWVNLTGDQAVAQDPEFFKKVFCINSNEFNWYSKSSTDYTALSQVPVYSRK